MEVALAGARKDDDHHLVPAKSARDRISRKG
jgi:hypothetical protein